MNPDFQVLSIGRANSATVTDIVLPASEDTIGHRHAEVSIRPDGLCHFLDLNSANGSFIEENGTWQRIRQTTVSLDTPLRLGSFETTAAALLRFRRLPPPSPPLPEPPPAKPRRNPLTGEIE